MQTALRLPDGSVAASAWPLDPRLRHLNHCSFGAVPQAALNYQLALKAEMERDPVAWFAMLPERIAAARAEVAQFLNCVPRRVAFVANASAGASVVFNSLPLAPDSEVVTTDHGYGAVTMGARRMAERAGVPHRILQIPLGADDDQVVDLVTAGLPHSGGLLVIDQITSPTAQQFPVGRICAVARAAGVVTLVDGAHGAGMLPDPIADADADYWVGNLHKYACSPRSTGVLVAREPDDSLWPVIDSWGAELPFPERFDYQGTLDLTAWLTAPWTLQWLGQTFGWDTLRVHSERMVSQGQQIIADAMAQATGVECLPQVASPCPAMRLIALPDGLVHSRLEADALRIPLITQARAAVGVTYFAGRGYLRISAHAYNSTADYQHFADQGVALVTTLRSPSCS